jgi:acetoin utilization deacetylase AcuC-like enzyme
MALAFITHPDCLLHDMGHAIPEIPERLRVIEEALKQSELANLLKKYSAPLATQEQLLRVHEKKYVDDIFNAIPEKEWVSLDPDTWMNSHSVTAALRAAGSTILAVDLIQKGEIDKAFCNVRPPGHHAEKDKAMGFCIFNNVAVGVAHALEEYALKRIAIVDFDAHHGNGTEDIFKHDDRVLFCSSFEHPFYPFSGADTKNSHILNVPLQAGTTGKIFREKVQKAWFEPIKKFKPELIFFSAGFDAYYQDPLSDLMLHEEDYHWITKEIKKIADQVCKGRMISVLEGGYVLQTLGGCVLTHIRAMNDE